MNSRDKILASICLNKPSLVDLPLIPAEEITVYDDPVGKFNVTLESIGGKVVELNSMQQLTETISNERAAGHVIVDMITGFNDEIKNKTALELETLDKAYLKAMVGVAENGAVWIPESQMLNRLLPFICQHLVIALERDKIVSTMHHAYQQIQSFEEGFGVFLAGPSKTADIEQSLVIGAHGARSLTVYLV